MTELASYAVVPTDAAPRYAKQLASHLGRKLEVREEGEGQQRIVFEGGNCLLVCTAEALELRAEAGSGDVLDRVEHVVGSHLERFGQRGELKVEWVRRDRH